MAYNTRPSNKQSRPGLLVLSPRRRTKVLAAEGQNSKISQGEQALAIAKVVKLQNNVLRNSEMAQKKESLPPPPATGKIQRGPSLAHQMSKL